MGRGGVLGCNRWHAGSESAAEEAVGSWRMHGGAISPEACAADRPSLTVGDRRRPDWRGSRLANGVCCIAKACLVPCAWMAAEAGDLRYIQQMHPILSHPILSYVP
jgi:hypothetical protein